MSFRSYLSLSEAISPLSMIHPWLLIVFPYDFPLATMIFPWFPHYSPWCPMIHHDFPMIHHVFPIIHHDFPIVILFRSEINLTPTPLHRTPQSLALLSAARRRARDLLDATEAPFEWTKSHKIATFPKGGHRRTPWQMVVWLVVWLTSMLFSHILIYWECHHPNWLIFFRGVQTTNQLLMMLNACKWWLMIVHDG